MSDAIPGDGTAGTSPSRRNRRERGRERLRRRVHLLPHLFTLGNLFAGFFSVSATLAGDYDRAAIAIGAGIVLDGLDGAVARLVSKNSPIGIQLDSLLGKRFQVGTAILEYDRPRPPCGYIEKLTEPGMTRALVGRGGICARVVGSGVIRASDPIVAL